MPSSEPTKTKPPSKVKAAKPVPSEIVERIVAQYEQQAEDRMGHLHNQFVAFIAAAQVPMPQVVLVLQMLLHEATTQALTKYLGGGER